MTLISTSILQEELDNWINWHNTEQTHSGKYFYGKTLWQTFLDSKHIALEKQLSSLPWQTPSNDENVKTINMI